MVYKQNVGVDVSKDSLDLNLRVLDKNFATQSVASKKFENTHKAFERIVDWVKNHMLEGTDVSFTLEFTGVYYEEFAYYLVGVGITVYMVIPSKAKRYVESLSKSSKTDKLDAKALSQMGLERQLKAWEPISESFLCLRTLTREREELLDEKTVISNRLHAHNHKAIQFAKTQQRYKDRLKMVNQQIADIEEEIAEFIKSDEALYQRARKVETIPGVSWTTIAVVLAETNGFASIQNQKQLTSYAGLDVAHKESGIYKGKTKISKQGNAHIRRALYFPAIVAVTHNKPLSTFYHRVNARKEKKMIAGVAVQRKLLCLMYTLWKNETVFDPYYEYKKRLEVLKKVG